MANPTCVYANPQLLHTWHVLWVRLCHGVMTKAATGTATDRGHLFCNTYSYNLQWLSMYSMQEGLLSTSVCLADTWDAS